MATFVPTYSAKPLERPATCTINVLQLRLPLQLVQLSAQQRLKGNSVTTDIERLPSVLAEQVA